MSSEKNAVKTLRKHVLARWPGAHWQRLEDSLSVGVPDVTVCWCDTCCVDDSWIHTGIVNELWIEVKEVDKLPVRASTPVKLGLRPEQAMWLDTAQRAGRSVCVMARGPWGWAWFNRGFDDLYRGVPWPELHKRASYISKNCDVAGMEIVI